MSSKIEQFQPLGGFERTIKVEFDKRFTTSELPRRLTFFVTSEANSFGVEFASFKNGNPFETQVTMNEQTSISFKPKMTKYLKEMRDGCEDKNFWSHVEERFIPELEITCPNQCTPFILPNKGITDICKTHTDFGCAGSIYMDALKEVKESFTMPCSTMEYNGMTEGKVIDGFPKLVNTESQ